jgi:UDP-GlcNAc:undecaprenyl-phosphate GlcNAc-1-phosphate transferase
MEYITRFYPTIVFFSLFNLLSFFIINHYKKNFSFLLDKPDGIRKLHRNPILMIGGVFVANYLILTLIYSYFYDLKIIFIIASGSILIFFIGLIDDCISLNPYKKLIIISVIILIVVNFNHDLKIQTLYFSFFKKNVDLAKYSLFFTILSILLLINCLNLSDGINGLAAGISIIWLIFSYIYANFELQIILLPLILLLILLFTWIIREKFFLGDNGSLLISSFIGFVIIFIYNQNLYNNSSIISVESIFILFMVPGVDMFRLFLERILKKRNPFKADRNHLHHLLIDKFSINNTLLIYFSLITFFILLDRSKLMQSIYLIIIFLFFYIFMIVKLKKKLKKN